VGHNELVVVVTMTNTDIINITTTIMFITGCMTAAAFAAAATASATAAAVVAKEHDTANHDWFGDLSSAVAFFSLRLLSLKSSKDSFTLRVFVMRGCWKWEESFFFKGEGEVNQWRYAWLWVVDVMKDYSDWGDVMFNCQSLSLSRLCFSIYGYTIDTFYPRKRGLLTFLQSVEVTGERDVYERSERRKREKGAIGGVVSSVGMIDGKVWASSIFGLQIYRRTNLHDRATLLSLKEKDCFCGCAWLCCTCNVSTSGTIGPLRAWQDKKSDTAALKIMFLGRWHSWGVTE
jgi:hypothetical protein